MNIFFLFLITPLVIFLAVAIPRYDRQRIREHVEAHRGKVIDIDSVWFGGSGRYGRTYKVTYESRQGKRITAPA